MHFGIVAWVLLAAPFWEAKPPEQWSVEELKKLLTDSPWALWATAGTRAGPANPVRMYLASARPMQQAENEMRRRGGTSTNDPLWQEYREYLEAGGGKYIVLAVALPDPGRLAEAGEARLMEQECRMRVGRKTFKLAAHFPPSSSDPHLRLVFPRVAPGGAERLAFELYLPSVDQPYRQVEFFFKDMIYQGQPAW